MIEATYEFEIPQSVFTVRVWMKLKSLKQEVDGDIINKVFGFLKSKGTEPTSREDMIDFIMSIPNVTAAQVLSTHGLYKVGKMVRAKGRKTKKVV